MNSPYERMRLARAVVADPRWASVLARDPAADGRFFYSVCTTGVYCRPSCPSRVARPEHVRFHATALEAERAGFRACKRCRPERPPLTELHTAMVADLCRHIEQAERMPTLAQLARRAGISAYYYLHRLFKSVTGVTPRAYADAQRARRLQRELRGDRPVTEAMQRAGYRSAARFYEGSPDVLGMTPRRYRSGGDDADIHFVVGRCSLGAILVAHSDRGICAITLGDDQDALAHELCMRFPRARLHAAEGVYKDWVDGAIRLVDSPRLRPTLPFDVRGTAFQRRVWEALRRIPVGSTATYAEVARRIGAPQAVRAVARACAANALAIAIPCHRVVRSDGGLAGYRWGVQRKKTLLERERELLPSPQD